MVHLSKKGSTDKELLKLYGLFFEILNKADDKDDFFELIKDILSPLEQIMVAKRIAIIYLLTKNVQQIDIAEYLKTSRATVAKFSLLFYEKEAKIIRILKEIVSREKIHNFLEDLFADLFIQPGFKIGHYKMAWEHKKRQAERKMIDV